jgi:hypothetical protein
MAASHLLGADALAVLAAPRPRRRSHQCRGGRKTAEEEERGMEAVCALLGAPALIATIAPVLVSLLVLQLL